MSFLLPDLQRLPENQKQYVNVLQKNKDQWS